MTIRAGGRIEEIAEYLTDRLNDAGAIVVRSRHGVPACLGFHTTRWRIVRDVMDAYQSTGASLRWPAPTDADCDRMQEAYGWVRAGISGSRVLRRILFLRSLIGPLTRRHLVSWKAIAAEVGAAEAAIHRWHRDGIEQVARYLDARHIPHG